VTASVVVVSDELEVDELEVEELVELCVLAASEPPLDPHAASADPRRRQSAMAKRDRVRCISGAL